METVIELDVTLMLTCCVTTYAIPAAKPPTNPRQAILAHKGNSPRRRTLKKKGILEDCQEVHLEQTVAQTQDPDGGISAAVPPTPHPRNKDKIVPGEKAMCGWEDSSKGCLWFTSGLYLEQQRAKARREFRNQLQMRYSLSSCEVDT